MADIAKMIEDIKSLTLVEISRILLLRSIAILVATATDVNVFPVCSLLSFQKVIIDIF